MTPEERAKAFVQSYGCGRGADYPCTTQEYCPCFGDVVHAFRQAENDKLEEVGALLDRMEAHFDNHPAPEAPIISGAVAELSARVRNLKSKD